MENISKFNFKMFFILSAIYLFSIIPINGKEFDYSNWSPDKSTAGVDVSLLEHERRKIEGVTGVEYYIETNGFPEGHLYSIWIKPSGGGNPQKISDGWSGGENGKLFCKKGKSKCKVDNIEQLRMLAVFFHKGERFQVAVQSKDGSVKGYGKAIPFPLASNSNECQIWGEMITPDLFEFFGKGFTPNKNVRVVSRSGKELIERDITADGQGEISRVLILPGVMGKSGGKTKIDFVGGNCTATLDYRWGDKIKVQ